MNNVHRNLKIAGVLLLIGGLQAWGFYSYITPQIDDAVTSLALLQDELPGNQLLDKSFEALQDLRRISNDEVRKRQILQLRQSFLQQYKEEPKLAIEEFLNVVTSFEAHSDLERELLTALRLDLSRLNDIYTDHFAIVIENYSSPPFYYQPAASLVTIGSADKQALGFNHALYLMLVGQRGSANSIYNELRLNADSNTLKSRILFAQSRMQYDAFRAGQDPEYYRQAVRHAQESLRHDHAYDLPKLFLEYLLGIDLATVEMEGSPIEGQGSGEAQGERGAISTDAPEH